jgi:hypothetical protein
MASTPESGEGVVHGEPCHEELDHGQPFAGSFGSDVARRGPPSPHVVSFSQQVGKGSGKGSRSLKSGGSQPNNRTEERGETKASPSQAELQQDQTFPTESTSFASAGGGLDCLILAIYA